MTKQELYIQCDSLEGNINRMCVTDSLEELNKMKLFAKNRIEKIYDYNFKRLSERGDKE